ncbi:2,4-dienoyl-CoA reductase [Desulfuromusa kysingii]|uniref:2,4-dienoyl-CoA reductase n=1 Tax=Desulfuromusa kysingii TaxID=37625 RepID=A0A1H3XE19_9BACT|nr:FAD-dependent oxidoreductase [Desulfuromusa kysingii]SDZ97470.1 2,4-dienoyl-CoA reductase [Desulfuromusa kysingii]
MKFSEAFELGQLKLKNRFIMAPVKSAYGNLKGEVTPRHLIYYDNLSKGGVAMIILEPVAVSKSGKEHPKQLTVHLPESQKNLEKIVTVLHQNDTLACLNINHAGRAANPKATGMAAEAPSAVPCPATGQTPEILQKAEIKGILSGYRRAIRTAIAAGFDAIEIQAGHGYLIQQFLSPRTNRREDIYGRDKSLFMKEVFDIVREERQQLTVLVRISGSEFVDGGFGPADNGIILKLAQEYGFDAIHCGFGNACDTPPWYYNHMALPEQKQQEVVQAIRKQTTLPLIVAGRMGDINKLETYERENLADCIALGRPLIADPNFVNKILHQQTDDITSCGYCLQGCLANVKNGSGIGCIVNPRIDKQPLQTKDPKTVAVIGGGPAGMAAATQLAMMGHQATLYEKHPTLGGQFELAYKAPHKESMLRPLHSLIQQTEKQAVNILLGTTATAASVENFDCCIVATGARQMIPEITGLDDQYSMTSLEFFAKTKPVQGKRILIIGAGMVGIEAAEMLADEGYDVVITKRTDTVGNDMEMITKKMLLKRLEQKKNLLISVNTTVLEFTKQQVKYKHHRKEGEWAPFDTVIIAAGMCPEDDLYAQLQATGKSVQLIGDAATPADIYAATQMGYLAAATLV